LSGRVHTVLQALGSLAQVGMGLKDGVAKEVVPPSFAKVQEG